MLSEIKKEIITKYRIYLVQLIVFVLCCGFIMSMTRLEFSYVLLRLLYLSLALYICFHFKYETNNSLSPAIVGFLCFMFSSYITVGLIKDDYLLFALSSSFFLIFIYIIIIYDKVAAWWKFITWQKTVDIEYYFLNEKKPLPSSFSLISTKIIVLSTFVLLIIYISTALTLNLEFSASEDNKHLVVDSYPDSKTLNISVKCNSLYSRFMSPPIWLSCSQPNGTNIKFSQQMVKPTSDSNFASILTINITDDINFTESPITIYTSWYLVFLPIYPSDKQPSIEYILNTPKILNLTTNKQNHIQVAGSDILLEAVVLSDRKVIYKFKKNGILLNNDENNRTYQWKTNLTDIGNNIIEALIEDVNDPSWIKSDKCVFEILNNNPPTVSISKVEGQLCFQAEGMDNENDSIEYMFVLYDNGGKFLLSRDWSNEASWVISSLKSGNYKIEVSVSDELHKWDNITNIMWFTVSKDKKRSPSTTKTSNERPTPGDEPGNNEQLTTGDEPGDTAKSTENEPTVKTPSPPGPIERANVIIGTITGK